MASGDGQPPTTATCAEGFRPGDVVSEKFRVQRVIGVGGMGVVLEAVHLALDERVALKVLHKEVLGQPDLVARFAQEARAAVKLKSEHIARVIDVGTERGVPYMVMEYLDGKNLDELVKQDGALDTVSAAEFLIQACEGI